MNCNQTVLCGFLQSRIQHEGGPLAARDMAGVYQDFKLIVAEALDSKSWAPVPHSRTRRVATSLETREFKDLKGVDLEVAGNLAKIMDQQQSEDPAVFWNMAHLACRGLNRSMDRNFTLAFAGLFGFCALYFGIFIKVFSLPAPFPAISLGVTCGLLALTLIIFLIELYCKPPSAYKTALQKLGADSEAAGDAACSSKGDVKLQQVTNTS